MAEYASNSYKSKEEAKSKSKAEEPARERRVQKVVSGEVSTERTRKRKLIDMFVSEDSGNLKEYVLLDVLVPAIKDTISTVIKDAIDIVLFGGAGGASGRTRNGSKITYTNYYRGSSRNDDRRASAPSTRGRFDYDEIGFNSRGDAELVLKDLNDIIDTYQWATVADLYDLAGLTPPYTSNNYGWTSIRTAEIVRVRGGKYIIDLPKASPID